MNADNGQLRKALELTLITSTEGRMFMFVQWHAHDSNLSRMSRLRARLRDARIRRRAAAVLARHIGGSV